VLFFTTVGKKVEGRQKFYQSEKNLSENFNGKNQKVYYKLEKT
jgi:hypothetical protein